MSVGYVYYTTGRTRTMRFNNMTVLFEHAPAKLVDTADTPSGRVLLALHHLGRERVTHETLDQVNERYPVAELLRVQATPAWLREQNRSLAERPTGMNLSSPHQADRDSNFATSRSGSREGTRRSATETCRTLYPSGVPPGLTPHRTGQSSGRSLRPIRFRLQLAFWDRGRSVGPPSRLSRHRATRAPVALATSAT